MKKRSIMVLAGFVLMSGWASADLVYSNNFSGTEFRADGVAAGAFGNTVASGGRLVSTNKTGNITGFRVDLRNLDLDTDLNVTAVKLTITGKAPLTADGGSYLALGFVNNTSVNLNGNGVPAVGINGNGGFKATGGLGWVDNALPEAPQGVNFTAGGDFTMSVIYHKNGTIDTWYNDVQVHSEQAITSSATPTLDYGTIQFRDLIIENGANVDTYTIEAIPEPATAGLFVISSTALLLVRRRQRPINC